MKTNKYYFYNGFSKPKEIDMENIVIENNYKGDVTDEVLEEHNYWFNESDKEYNEHLGYYGIYRNPTLEELQEVNRMYGLGDNDYLEDFINNQQTT